MLCNLPSSHERVEAVPLYGFRGFSSRQTTVATEFKQVFLEMELTEDEQQILFIHMLKAVVCRVFGRRLQTEAEPPFRAPLQRLGSIHQA